MRFWLNLLLASLLLLFGLLTFGPLLLPRNVVALTLNDWKKVASIGKDLVQGLGVVVAGLWAYRRFWREGLGNPRVDFDAAMQSRLVSVEDNRRLVEIEFFVRNVGFRRLEIEPRTFYFTLRLLDPDALRKEACVPLRSKEDSPLDAPGLGQVHFSQKLRGNQIVVPAAKKGGWPVVFIEPGVQQRFSYQMAIPLDAKAALLQAQFDLRHVPGEDQRLQRVFDLTSLPGRTVDSQATTKAAPAA